MALIMTNKKIGTRLAMFLVRWTRLRESLAPKSGSSAIFPLIYIVKCCWPCWRCFFLISTWGGLSKLKYNKEEYHELGSDQRKVETSQRTSTKTMGQAH